VAAQAAPAVHQVAAPAQLLGDGGNNNNANNNATTNNNNNGKGEEGRGGGRRHEERRRHEEGRIFINERSYSAHSDGCITVISGLGAKTLNIRNDSHRRVEVFRGAVCDNGAPVATVGPWSTSDGVKVRRTGAVEVKQGVVASFRVVSHHGEDRGRGGERGGERGDDRY
jgi:hypothetical protein